MKKGNKSLLKNVLLKRNIFNLFLKISTQGRGAFFGPKGSLVIQGAEFQSFGAQTANARSPYVYKLEKAVASRLDKDDPLRLRADQRVNS